MARRPGQSPCPTTVVADSFAVEIRLAIRQRSVFLPGLNSMRLLFIILSLAIPALAEETNTPPLFKLEDVLPSGRCDLELMTVEFSDRAKELTLKWQAAVATNQDWFLEQVKRAKPGKPLDYDPRLGITQEEWAEYLREAENRHLASTATRVPCLFRRRGDMLTIDIGDTNSPLSKIRLNLKTGRLFASVGLVGMPTWKATDDPASPIGTNEACSWRYESSDLETFNVRIVKLDIWRLKSSGKILWRFKDAEVVKKQSKLNFEVLFQHSPKGVQHDGGSSGTQPFRPETNQTSSATDSHR
jgi:hypothetical protein